MSIIQVISKQFPKRGRFIAEGSYQYFATPEGLPAFAFQWKGIIFPGDKATFVFARDTVQIGLLPDETTRSQARMAGFSRSSKVPGILPGLIFGALGAAVAQTKNIQGFGVLYNNDDGHLGAFFAAAPPEIVDAIVRSIPPERYDASIPPPQPPPLP